MLTSDLISKVFGITFILVGLLGFVPNPIVAPDGIFAVNTMHNFVHVITGAAFLAGRHYGYSRNTLLGIGVAYVIVTIVGFLTSGNMLLGIIHINAADRWLHAGLALVILAAGVIASDDTSEILDR